MAGALGLEPRPTVLETDMLPITPCPYGGSFLSVPCALFHSIVTVARDTNNEASRLPGRRPRIRTLNNGVRVRYVAITPVAYMVWVAGFEPATSCSLSKRATKLHHTQIWTHRWESNPLTQVLQTCPRPTRICAMCGKCRLFFNEPNVLHNLIKKIFNTEHILHRIA